MIWPLRLSFIAIVVFLLGPLLARGGGGPKLPAMLVSLAGVAVGLVLAIVGAVSLARGGGWQAGLAIAISLVPLATIVPVLVQGSRVPRINDVTTDVDDPPAFAHAAVMPENAKRDLSFPASNKEIVRKAYADLKPLVIAGTPDDVFERARRAAQTMPGWAMAAADPGKRTIECSTETGVFHFVDDIVIRVRPSANGSSVIDVRSKSREGQGDFGANAARIRAYLARVQSPI